MASFGVIGWEMVHSYVPLRVPLAGGVRTASSSILRAERNGAGGWVGVSDICVRQCEVSSLWWTGMLQLSSVVNKGAKELTWGFQALRDGSTKKEKSLVERVSRGTKPGSRINIH